MTWFVIHTVLLLLAAFIIGCVLGCWLKGVFGAEATVDVPSMPKPAVQPVASPTSAPVVPAPANDIAAPVVEVPAVAAPTAELSGEKPTGLEAARGGKADNLKRIRGIGPANEKKLNALGIFHFDQIAAWGEAQAEWVNSFLAFPGRIEREDWINQAKALATGVETEFSKRVDKGEVESSL